MGRLDAAEIVQRNILLALQLAVRVPLGFAMANVIDGRCGHRNVSYSLGYSLPPTELTSEISGASGRFMPTTW